MLLRRRLAAHRRPRRDNGDGTYTFIGRKKEVIRRRGENLAPAEVEEALASHPDVVEAAVVGVPSDLSEEEVKAFVVLRDGAPTSPPCAAWAAERLTRFKVPRYVEVVDELPHTPTGRIAKHQLPRERTDRRDRLRETARMSDERLAAHRRSATSDADSITLMGRDLASELMGKVTFTELAFLLVARRACRAPGRRGCSTPSWCRWPTTG